MNIIDRRLNPKGKSLANRQRFLRRAKEQIVKAVRDSSGKRSIQYMYTSGREDGVAGIDPGHTPYLNMDDWFCGMTMGCPSRLYQNSYPADFRNTWPIGEAYFNTPWVWAHSEFTPQQTMRGKTALYGYLYALGGATLRGRLTGENLRALADVAERRGRGRIRKRSERRARQKGLLDLLSGS